MPQIDNDPSANTARFRAFAERSDEDFSAAGRRRSSASRVLIVAVGVVCAALVIGVLVATL